MFLSSSLLTCLPQKNGKTANNSIYIDRVNTVFLSVDSFLLLLNLGNNQLLKTSIVILFKIT